MRSSPPRALGIGAAAAALLLFAVSAFAARAADVDGVFKPGSPIAASTMQVEADHAAPLDLPSPAVTVFVANPAIADVQAKDARRILVIGRKVGGTTIYVTDKSGQVTAHAVNVVRPTAAAAETLAAQPGSSKVRVRPAPRGVTVEGITVTPREAASLKAAADQYADDKDGVNFNVGLVGETQVNLQVRIVEVSRSVSRSLGFNWDSLSNNGSTILGLATGRPIAGADGVIPPATRSAMGASSFLFGYRSPGGSVNVNGVIDALQTEGVVSILAQPNLTAASGQTASFLAGGEFPVPIAQMNNSISIEWKKFGVALDFTPVVLDPGRLSIKVRPEVSEITDKGAVTIENIKVPGLAVRRAETTVELASGQSFAIAGLFQNNMSSSVNEFPWLKDIPVLGALLRSTSFQHDESELVIIVTPYIVRPVNQLAALRTPADSLVFANELEQAVLGRVQMMPKDHPHYSGPAGFILEDKP